MSPTNFIVDVDGVLTTGQFHYSSEGKVFKIFGKDDSDGLSLLKNFIKIIFISGDKKGFEISKKRVQDMGFEINLVSTIQRVKWIQENSNIDVPRLLTAALGLGSETGEFVEIVKKMVLQGKPADEDNIFHMKRELGDVMWYWATACMSLGLDPVEVIKENQKKLEARYGDQFTIDQSEVRAKGDL